jgi:nucleoside-diphosphate-sugar epimerase
MKILVTGALGHIGSRLIRNLPFAFPKSKIVMIDNMMTQRYCSLFNLPQEGLYEFIEGDILKLDVYDLIQDVNVVVHLAAITDATGSFDKAEQVEQNNLTSTMRLAEACTKRNVRLILLSSTSIYGSQTNQVDENCEKDELKPQSPYAVTKLKEEILVKKYVTDHGLRSVILRFGTIFGVSPGMRFHTAVNKFCWQAALGQAITIWRTAYDQKRPYLEIDDACNAIVHAIREDLGNGSIYNVLTQNLTVRDIVDKIRIFIPTLEIVFIDNKIMNQLSYEVSDEKFRKTGYKPESNIIESIKNELLTIKVNKKIVINEE